MTISERYPFPDSAMIHLAIRALKGDKRHQYTMECLKERNEEAYNRIMKAAKDEIPGETEELEKGGLTNPPL